MSFRDDHEAARARLEVLERELESARAELESSRVELRGTRHTLESTRISLESSREEVARLQAASPSPALRAWQMARLPAWLTFIVVLIAVVVMFGYLLTGRQRELERIEELEERCGPRL